MKSKSEKITVFVLFESFGDGDACVRWDFRGVFESLELARSAIPNTDFNPAEIHHTGDNGHQWIERPRNRLIHESMSVENKFSYFGSRSDCSSVWEGAPGWVIEEVEFGNLFV